jgi:HK97 family phage major capsid protein
MLPWSVPMSLQGNGAYLMNRHTWALCSTMSDANGRPIMTAAPTEAAPFLLAGSPVIIAQQMPDVKRRLDPDRLRKLEAGVHGGEPQGRNHAG